jgi:hypothetical protein
MNMIGLNYQLAETETGGPYRCWRYVVDVKESYERRPQVMEKENDLV